MSDDAAPARILIVDDDPGMVRAVTRILERHHEVISALGPAAALEQVAAARPDLAIVDVRMPEMSGFDLMRHLRALCPEIDVIVMTGSVAETDTHLMRAIDEGAFYFIQKPFERRVLRTLVARCLELRRLQKEKQRHLARLERELDEARRFQHGLLPPAGSDVRGFRLDARYLACSELAGDFYDYAAAGETHVALLVADVSGHGASAAMLTGLVKAAFHSARDDAYEPIAVVHRTVESIRVFDPGRFVTLLTARLDRGAGVMTYASAGHPPAIVGGPGREPRLLDSTGPLISSGFLDVPWEQRRVDLAAGDRILLYTDGLLEAQGQDGMFGSERLVSVIRDSRRDGAGLLDEIMAALGAFAGARPYRDDITLLTARVG